MSNHVVAIVKFETALESVRKAVLMSGGLDRMPRRARVFIKPNIVFWTRAAAFPKWGVLTTSRVVEDMVVLLKAHGIDDITIGEGMVTLNPNDRDTPAHAFETLGYGVLKNRYGVKVINVFDRPFDTVELGDGLRLNFNTDILNSDFVVDLPTLKTHSQTIVSLGIKNLKGTIDIPSRKKCHSADPQKDLHFWVARLADKLPPIFTLIDGIYSLERGPAFDGKMHRSNLLIASADTLSADMVGASVLGYAPSQVPYLVHAAHNCERPLDLSDIDIVGEAIRGVTKAHAYDFPYSESESGVMPTPMAKQGLKGLFYRKYDLSLCTYCSFYNGVVLSAIRFAWKGKPWQDIEILTGKTMKPTPGMGKTVLLGKCIYQANKDHPDIQEMIAVKGCPPKPKDIVKALQQAGFEVDPALFDNIDALPGFFMSRYDGQPEFVESFFRIT